MPAVSKNCAEHARDVEKYLKHVCPLEARVNMLEMTGAMTRWSELF